MHKIIEQTFIKMVEAIQKTKTVNIEPNRYHKTALINEINLVYHFAKLLEKETEKCVTYLEFPCDSGKIDAVILYENNILCIEAKANIDNQKLKVLNEQSARFENTNPRLKNSKLNYLNDNSLREALEDRACNFIVEKWDTTEKINIYGILLADTVNKYQMGKWGNNNHYKEYSLSYLKDYKHLKIIEDDKSKMVMWYLGSYKKIATLQI